MNSLSHYCRRLPGMIVLCLLPGISLPAIADDYAGSRACAVCHSDAYRDWRSSDHFQAMLPATEAAVVGDFSGQQVSFHGIPTRFSRSGETFLVELGNDADRSVHQISHTFGHYPLQQYLVATDGGRLQALNTAWDSRPKAAGGQRWFHLRDEADMAPVFQWDRHLQNWNSGCADCHSTNVQLGFDQQKLAFETSYAEVNVGCEACHGPGAGHVETALAGAPASALVNAQASREGFVDMCGGCHSRRAVIGEVVPGQRYGEQYRLSLLDDPLYFPDGQARDEVFVLGSYRQSRMFNAGVTCMNCHNPHSGKTLTEGNPLCTQCHQSLVYETPDHLRHEMGNPGSQCVDCHMPTRTYMQVDDRRDHRFGIPDPAQSLKVGTPDACASCHSDKPRGWAADQLKPAKPDRYTSLMLGLGTRDPMMVADASLYILDRGNADIRRATLLSNLPLTDASIRTALTALTDEDDLVRRAAVQALQGAPASVRRLQIPLLAADPSYEVRVEAGRIMADITPQLEVAEQALAEKLVAGYRASLQWTIGSAATQASLGQLDVALGRIPDAKQSLERAMAIEPEFIPALLNLADIHRAEGDEAQAGELLRRAVDSAPDSAAANFSFALHLVRGGDLETAIRFLSAATLQMDAAPRYAYVYAVALDTAAQTAQAVDVLRNASTRWPNQYDLLMLEILYREKTGLLGEIGRPLRALALLAPEEPAVQQRLQRYLQNPMDSGSR